MQDKPIQEKSSSDELVQVLARLSTDQVRFVVARQEFSTDKMKDLIDNCLNSNKCLDRCLCKKFSILILWI